LGTSTLQPASFGESLKMGQPSKDSKTAYELSERGRARRKAHYESKKSFYQEYERNRQYQKMYGITLAEYVAMLVSQDSKCRICGTAKPGNRHRNFSVDHCHASGRVRGLLCTRCNVGLGFYEKFGAACAKYISETSQ
jgi:hypothetical protein